MDSPPSRTENPKKDSSSHSKAVHEILSSSDDEPHEFIGGFQSGVRPSRYIDGSHSVSAVPEVSFTEYTVQYQGTLETIRTKEEEEALLKRAEDQFTQGAMKIPCSFLGSIPLVFMERFEVARQHLSPKVLGERTLPDGRRLKRYSSGTVDLIRDSKIRRIFPNGDQIVGELYGDDFYARRLIQPSASLRAFQQPRLLCTFNLSRYNFVKYHKKIYPVMMTFLEMYGHSFEYRVVDDFYGALIACASQVGISKVWKCRIEGYEDIIKKLIQTEDLLTFKYSDDVEAILLSAWFNNIPVPRSLVVKILEKYLKFGNLKLVRRLLKMDPSLYQEKYFLQLVREGDSELAWIFANASDHDWIKKAWVGDTIFSQEDWDQLSPDQQTEVYEVANSYNRQRLVRKIHELGYSVNKCSEPVDDIEYPLSPNMDVCRIQDYLNTFFRQMKMDGMLIIAENFSQPEGWISKGNDFGRILGRNYIQRKIDQFQLTHVHVPKKYLVIPSSRLTIRFWGEFQPRIQEDVQVFAQKVERNDRHYLTREEFQDLLTILVATGYRDLHWGNFIIGSDGVYLIDTEYGNFDSHYHIGAASVYHGLSEEDQEWGEQIAQEIIQKYGKKVDPYETRTIHEPFIVDLAD